MSARRARSCTIAAPSGWSRSMTTLRLLRLADRNVALSPCHAGGVHERVSSPEPGCSILMTSAPRSPRIIVQNGPARLRVRSSTLRPANGAGAEVVSSTALVYSADTLVDTLKRRTARGVVFAHEPHRDDRQNPGVLRRRRRVGRLW